MHISDEVLDGLDWTAATSRVLSEPLLQMPMAVWDESLSQAGEHLWQQTRALAKGAGRASIEVVTMPKRGFGGRPIGLMSPQARVLFETLVSALGPALPPASRDQDWAAFESVGAEGGDRDRLIAVDLDIAACYEYIDHATLAEELVLQGGHATIVYAVADLLREMYPRGRAIPQSMRPSHRLADAYLEVISRGLRRLGFEVHRYADDFRIFAASREAAQDALERAGDLARSAGLALSDGKSSMTTGEQLRTEMATREKALEEYRAAAEIDLTVEDFVRVGYEEYDVVRYIPDDVNVDEEVYHRIVSDWAKGDGGIAGRRFGPSSLVILAKAHRRVSDDLLEEVVAREPIHLKPVLEYLLARPELDANWSSLARLAQLPRGGPWARLWIASATARLSSGTGASYETVMDWAREALSDRHEAVRAQALWSLCSHGETDLDRVADVYGGASLITATGVAASAGLLSAGSASAVANAIRDDSLLNKDAFAWGESRAH